jgi:hypothetical protein
MLFLYDSQVKAGGHCCKIIVNIIIIISSSSSNSSSSNSSSNSSSKHNIAEFPARVEGFLSCRKLPHSFSLNRG